MRPMCKKTVAIQAEVAPTSRPIQRPNADDKIAQLYGFDTSAELLQISEPLPMQPGDSVQSYVARLPDGRWFVWTDELPPSIRAEPRYPKTPPD